MRLRDTIRVTIREYTESLKGVNCEPLNLTPQIVKEIKKFRSSEELLRSGGISMEALDRAAFGFSPEDIKTLLPKQLNIKWKEDLENVKYEIQYLQKKTPHIPLAKVMKMWASNVDLSEPIEVVYEKNKFFIEDGHHRYYAAKILGKPLNVTLEIKMNPISKLTTLSYDDFHRCAFNQVHESSKPSE